MVFVYRRKKVYDSHEVIMKTYSKQQTPSVKYVQQRAVFSKIPLLPILLTKHLRLKYIQTLVFYFWWLNWGFKKKVVFICEDDEKKLLLVFFCNTPKARGKILYGVCWGNQEDANFWIGLQTYCTSSLQHSVLIFGNTKVAWWFEQGLKGYRSLRSDWILHNI